MALGGGKEALAVVGAAFDAALGGALDNGRVGDVVVEELAPLK
jgi:hypothetical protein